MSIFDGTAGTPAGYGLSLAAMGQANALQNTSQNITTGGYIINAQQAAAAQQIINAPQAAAAQQQEQKPPLVFDPDNPAWSESISTIVDLWLAKFGDKWVDEKDLLHDTFFAIVATRLLQTNRLEKHTVPTNFFSVYRIVE